MPDRTQDLKNHRQVAVACKNYTDTEIKKSEERILSIVARNNVDFIDHINEPTYRFTAPANAKLLMLQSIGGNTVKLSPSVASDSTKAMIKTMPSTVYTFDGSKFEGDSKVSENECKPSTFRTSVNTFSFTNGVLTSSNVDGEPYNYASSQFNVYLSVGSYVIKFFDSNIDTGAEYNGLMISEGGTQSYYGIKDALVNNGSVSINIATAGMYGFRFKYRGSTKPMLVKGSTAPTEFKVGFSGIHNIELSGLVVKNSDDEVSQTLPIDLTTIVDSNNNKLFPNGKLMGNENVKDVLGVYNQQSKWIEYTFTGNETWTKSGVETNNSYYCNVDSLVFANTTATPTNVTWDNTIPNLVHTKYSATSGNLLLNTDLANVITLVNRTNGLQIRFGAGLSNDLTPEQVAQLFANTTLQYERATPLTSNTDLSATLRNIQGYPNGSIIAENTHNMDVESVITYNSIIQETLCPSVTVEGANKAKLQDIAQTTINGITYKVSNNSVTLGGTATSATSLYLPFVEDIEIGTYSYNQFYKNTGHNVYLAPAQSSSDTTLLITQNSTATSNANFTTTMTMKYLFIYIGNGNSITTYTFTPMLVRGSTPPTTFKPYKPSITRNLPTQASDGWSAGTQRNYRVFCDDEGNEVLKRETNVDKLNSLNIGYSYNSQYDFFYANVTNNRNVYDVGSMPNILTNNYTTDVVGYDSTMGTRNNMTITNTRNNNIIQLKNTLYDNASDFNKSMNGLPLYYEFNDASKTESDMDDFDFFFDVEEGDVITFNNPYAQQVYATYSFLIKEAKSNE